MIALENLTRTFGARAATVRAVDDISLDIGPGVTAVVGPNGAGKTTLLGLVLGFLGPTSGTVRIDGQAPRRWIRTNGAAYLPERFHLPPEWPVDAALRSLARLDGLSSDDAAARVPATLDRLGLAEYRHRAIGTLSRGLNQRLGLAQALLADRELVVLDEPTEGLDPLWRVRFREIVVELRDAGRTVLLASHELPEVERLADRVLVLREGGVQEVVEIAGEGGGPVRYRLDVVVDDDTLDATFPASRRTDQGVLVTVADARELSDRLAALIDRGGIIRAVTPVGVALEARVRGGEDA